MVHGYVKYLVAGLALLGTGGRLALVGFCMEVQLVMVLCGVEDVARFAPVYLGGSLRETSSTVTTLQTMNSLLDASAGGVQDV